LNISLINYYFTFIINLNLIVFFMVFIFLYYIFSFLNYII